MINCNNNAPACSFMDGLPSSSDDSIYVCKNAGDLSLFSSIAGVPVSAYICQRLACLLAYGCGKVFASILQLECLSLVAFSTSPFAFAM